MQDSQRGDVRGAAGGDDERQDLDGDGRRDIYVGNDLSANVLLLNKGRGAFEAAARFPVEDPVWGAVTRAPGCIKEFRGATVAEVSDSDVL